nr:MAG TPA: hypothetical protein [Caudoviricetes sp.]
MLSFRINSQYYYSLYFSRSTITIIPIVCQYYSGPFLYRCKSMIGSQFMYLCQ